MSRHLIRPALLNCRKKNNLCSWIISQRSKLCLPPYTVHKAAVEVVGNIYYFIVAKFIPWIFVVLPNIGCCKLMFLNSQWKKTALPVRGWVDNSAKKFQLWFTYWSTVFRLCLSRGWYCFAVFLMLWASKTHKHLWAIWQCMGHTI